MEKEFLTDVLPLMTLTRIYNLVYQVGKKRHYAVKEIDLAMPQEDLKRRKYIGEMNK